MGQSSDRLRVMHELLARVSEVALSHGAGIDRDGTSGNGGEDDGVTRVFERVVGSGGLLKPNAGLGRKKEEGIERGLKPSPRGDETKVMFSSKGFGQGERQL